MVGVVGGVLGLVKVWFKVWKLFGLRSLRGRDCDDVEGELRPFRERARLKMRPPLDALHMLQLPGLLCNLVSAGLRILLGCVRMRIVVQS